MKMEPCCWPCHKLHMQVLACFMCDLENYVNSISTASWLCCYADLREQHDKVMLPNKRSCLPVSTSIYCLE